MVGPLKLLVDSYGIFPLLALPPRPPFPVWLESVWQWLTPTLGQPRSISARFPNVLAASSRCLWSVAPGRFSVVQSFIRSCLLAAKRAAFSSSIDCILD